MEPLDLNAIDNRMPEFPESRYYQDIHEKKQIYIHHTVSGDSVDGDVSWWIQDDKRIATCVLIGRDGLITQVFSSKYWAHHLGIKSSIFSKYDLPAINTKLNRESIGIELDSWGGLAEGTDGWYNAVWSRELGKYVPGKSKVRNVTLYPEGYRGFYAYETYTKEQIKSLCQLILFWHKQYNIPICYHDGMWDLSTQALSGEPGIWTHTSVRPDKSDCHPQKELKEALLTLSQHV